MNEYMFPKNKDNSNS